MNANDRQVGGTHYQNSFQHWDLAHELNLGYFEGQISKYVTRHRFKKGREDAEKALHFTDKLAELVRMHGKLPEHKFITDFRLGDYVVANNLTTEEHRILRALFSWATLQDLSMVRLLLINLIDRTYGIEDTGEPGPGYVNQG
jgi:hypothetical protein